MNIFLKFWYFLLVLTRVKKPAKAQFTITQIAENYEMATDTMIYTLDLGPYDHDVVEREILIRIEGVTEDQILKLNPAENNQVQVKGPQDAKATVTVVDYDDSGNKSVPVVHEQILADIVPPGAGSNITVVAVEEISGVDDDDTGNGDTGNGDDGGDIGGPSIPVDEEESEGSDDGPAGDPGESGESGNDGNDDPSADEGTVEDSDPSGDEPGGDGSTGDSGGSGDDNAGDDAHNGDGNPDDRADDDHVLPDLGDSDDSTDNPGVGDPETVVDPVQPIGSEDGTVGEGEEGPVDVTDEEPADDDAELDEGDTDEDEGEDGGTDEEVKS